MKPGVQKRTNQIAENILLRFGIYIKALRDIKGISQTRLAKMSHVSQSEISRIELGKQDISIDTMVKLADALNISLSFDLKKR